MVIVRVLLFCLFTVVLSVVTIAAQASEAMLRNFFSDVNNLQANFNQLVIDETGFTLERSSGKVYLSRPGKFRWDYFDNESSATDPVLTQQILADGKSIYLYDPELEQATQRRLQDALGQVPSLLLVQKSTDVDRHFEIVDFGLTDGLSWVALKPKDSDAAYQQLMIGFDQAQIAAIELIDGLGNETHLSLSDVQSNDGIDSSVFVFDVPDSVDVLSE